jgi:hypothetical protein
MTGSEDRKTRKGLLSDAWAGMKIAGLALIAWAVIGIGLRLSSGFDPAGSMFTLVLLFPALIGVFVSGRSVLYGSAKFQSTISLMVNVMLAVSAILLTLYADGTP